MLLNSFILKNTPTTNSSCSIVPSIISHKKKLHLILPHEMRVDPSKQGLQYAHQDMFLTIYV